MIAKDKTLRPLAIIRHNRHYLKKGSVLDVGSGLGGNALFLAREGFMVEALDKDPDKLESLQKNALEMGCSANITTKLSNIAQNEFDKTYNNVICTFVLHFLPVRLGKLVVTDIQASTTPGGLNIISSYTNKGEVSEAEQGQGYWLKTNELKELYSGWEIIEYAEQPGRLRRRSDPTQVLNQMAACIVARKPSLQGSTITSTN